MVTYEIERKFLTSNFDFEILAELEPISIDQFYLNDDPLRTVRIRITNETAYITIKGQSSNDGLKRLEWEKEIDKNEAIRLKDLAVHHPIKKKRYKYSFKGFIYEIDVFEGSNQGLILVEIELKNEKEKIKKPKWLGEEVTGKQDYYNLQLSKYPFKKESGL